MKTETEKQTEIERVAKTIFRLTNCIPTPAIDSAIRGAGIELANLILGEDYDG